MEIHRRSPTAARYADNPSFRLIRSKIRCQPLLFVPFVTLFGVVLFYIDSTCFSRYVLLAPEFIQG
jgi:hypothetical protein